MKKFDILTLFPDYFRGPFDVSMIKKAQGKGLLEINTINIRDFAEGKYKQVDDRPYGGGPGMVLMPQPIIDAIKSVKKEDSFVIYLSPQGRPLKANKCKELAKKPHLIILCGRYEGVDERVIDLEVDEEISIGDFVMSGGEPAAAALVDSVMRFIPGAIGHKDAVSQDSFEDGFFDDPKYTRPPIFMGKKVPEVLMNGNHAKIEVWRNEKRRSKTRQIRPELVKE